MRVHIIAVLGITLCAGQALPATKTPTASATPIQVYQNIPFDTDQDRLAPGFAGADLQKTIAAVAALNITPRGEFESTPQFEQRLAGLSTRPVLGSLTLASTFAFSFSVPSQLTKYDADKNVFDAQNSPMIFGSSPAISDLTPKDFMAQSVFQPPAVYSYWMWRKEDVSASQYPGANAYGARVTVTKVAERGMAAVVCAAATSPRRCPTFQRSAFQLKLDSDEAQKAKSNTALLLIGTLASPYLLKDEARIAPTVTSALERILAVEILNLRPASIWIYNQASGTVYSKLQVVLP
jgi:hypothetical protein